LLHNLNDDGTHEVLARNNNSDSKQQFPGNKTAKKIPVILTGPTPIEAIREMDPTYNTIKKNAGIRNTSKPSQIKTRNKHMNSQKEVKHKVLIIGDSHVKKCAAELRSNLDQEYMISGFSKPGALTNEILETSEKEINTLGSKDVLILWAGANDISKNNTKGAIKNLTSYLEVQRKTNIVLINTPHRHDLVATSCVNKEVEKYNRQLKKIVKLYTNVELMELELKRKHFTGQGQHLNYSGKELVSKELAKKIERHLAKSVTIPIEIQWKADNPKEINLETQNKIGDQEGIVNQEKPTKPTKSQDKKAMGTNKEAKCEEPHGEETADTQGKTSKEDPVNPAHKCVVIPGRQQQAPQGEETADTQGNASKENPVNPAPNCAVTPEREQQEVRMSTRSRKIPLKLSKDFL
jgi:hypothetical protein